jgi:hypothetical protein
MYLLDTNETKYETKDFFYDLPITREEYLSFFLLESETNAHSDNYDLDQIQVRYKTSLI